MTLLYNDCIHIYIYKLILIWWFIVGALLYNYNDSWSCSATTEFVQFLVASYSVCFYVVGVFHPCSSSAYCAPGKKVTVPIYKVCARHGRESKSWPTSTEADTLTTRQQAGLQM